MSGRKQAHLNEVIRQKLSVLLHREANDPRFQGVTVTAVRLSPDYATARVEFSMYQKPISPDDVAASLNKAAGFFSKALGRTLDSRRTPRLSFHYDPGFDYAQDIDLLLKKTRKNDD